VTAIRLGYKKHLMLCRETITVFFSEKDHHHHYHQRLYSPGWTLASSLRTIPNLNAVFGQNLEFWRLNLKVSKVTTGLSGAYHLTISAAWKTYCNIIEQTISSLWTNVLRVLKDRVLLR